MTRSTILFACFLLILASGSIAARRPRVFKVCNRTTVPCGRGGRVRSIARAVKRAKPGDWILVWPGVYHEKATPDAGVMITKPGIHLRGMDRNLVIVDGSNGTAAAPCPADALLQDLTARNGIEAFKVSGVTIENLTVCNYLANYGDGGNEIWWNGGDGSGTIGMGSYSGAFLTATSMFYQDANSPMAMYGIFASNARGPGTITDSYASNMGDSDFYVGACPDCNATLSRVHAQNSSLGYSGTNAGGHLILEDSEWDHNKSGIVPSSLNNDDAPPPQNGQCPSGPGSCTIFRRNHVHDNNNPNVPASGISGEAPVGAGIEIVGGMFDTIEDNVVENQGAWGIVTHDFPDTETPPPISHCEGGIQSGPVCVFEAKGNVITGNTLRNNGSFGNPTNGDLANESSSTPRNCFYGNTDPNGLSSEPPMIETVDGPPCDQQGVGSGLLAQQLTCAAGIAPCPPGSSYPQPTQVQMLPLARQTPMPDPCAGVPKNPWCPYTGPRS
ncbi:MAG: hypothetical protein E6J75_05015 [Deltaproteobacteria bacterium]|nr:MAG: hypothetical protein E6J75_05015 [Deltaproteobacteria bacterium]